MSGDSRGATLLDARFPGLRRLEDLLTRLARKYGDMKGKVEMSLRPDVSLADIGGLTHAKREIEGLVVALRSPEIHQRWGTRPAKGTILYGPPETGKTLLARALAREAEAVFVHLRVANIVSKWLGDAGEMLQEVFSGLRENARVILYFDEIGALAPDRQFGPEFQGVSRRILNTLVENLDSLEAYAQILAVASTIRPDSLDPSLVAPGRLDRIIEVPLPEADEKREILQIHQAKSEERAGRPLFAELDYDAILARMGRMSGGDIAEVVRRALEERVRVEATGQAAAPVTTPDLLLAIEQHRRIKEVLEKIRYGQYL
jgi:transitional endoplasmic reticulum ATPase